MALLSRTCEYGLQAVIYIALNQGEDKKVGLTEIADAQEIPPHFLSKILQQLVKQKILKSTKGLGGGFRIIPDLKELTVIDLVKAIDGLDFFDHCALGLKDCSDEKPCAIHDQFKVIKNRIMQVFSTKNIADICRDIESGAAVSSLKLTE